MRSLLEPVYGRGVTDALLPPRRPGPRPGVGPWSVVPAPARRAIEEALHVPEIPTDPGWWTAERTGAAAEAITRHYTNPTSATLGLTRLRSALASIRADVAAIEATLRPELTEEHNARIANRRQQRAAEGIELPPPFMRVGDLKARAQAFVRSPPTDPPTAQDAADLLVIWSARPGEAQTLTLGSRGGVVGALKKKDETQAFPIVSAVGRPLAEGYLQAWKAKRAAGKRGALVGLTNLTAQWGLQPRDLRAIGAQLAVRAAVLNGEAPTEGAQREVRRTALRHAGTELGAEPQDRKAEATEHYERVRDPTATLAAELAELPPEELEAVRSAAAKASRRRSRASPPKSATPAALRASASP